MEKTIEIDGRQVSFKASASFLLRYRAYFGEDALIDFDYLNSNENTTFRNVIIMEKIEWAMAKNADPSIPPLEEWIDSFDEFHTVDIFVELSPIINKSMAITKQIDDAVDDEKNVKSAVKKKK